MTNRQKIETLPDEQYADYLIKKVLIKENNDCDWDDDEFVSYITYFETPDRRRYEYYEDAAERTIQWLNEEIDG